MAAKPAAAAPPASMPESPAPFDPGRPLVSGIVPQKRAMAPTLGAEPTGQNPVKELQERQRAAIAARVDDPERKAAAAGQEPAAKLPKAETPPAGKPSASPPAAAGATDGKAESGTADAKADESKSDSSDERTPRYTVQALKKWAEENPEDAAKAFGVPADERDGYIRLKNKARKVRAEIQSHHEKTMAEVRAEREATESAKAAIDGAAGKLAPIADLWEAVREKVTANPDAPEIDYEAADAAFLENAGITVDEYMRHRARRRIGSSPDAVRLRVENQKLKRQLETSAKPTEAGAPTSTEKGEAGTAAPAPKPKREAKDWADELPGKHKLRQIDGWNELLDVEMRKYRDSDTGDYDADPEEIANKILKREIERMLEDEPPADDDTPARTPKPKPNGAAKPAVQAKPRALGGGIPSAAELTPRKSKVADAAEGGDDDQEVLPKGYKERERRALARHQMRMRGEIE